MVVNEFYSQRKQLFGDGGTHRGEVTQGGPEGLGGWRGWSRLAGRWHPSPGQTKQSQSNRGRCGTVMPRRAGIHGFAGGLGKVHL